MWWFIETLFDLQAKTQGASGEALLSRLNADFGHLANEAGLPTDEVFERLLALSSSFANEWLDEQRLHSHCCHQGRHSALENGVCG